MMASTRRPKVTIVREYDTNNIDIETKPAPKQEFTSDEVTIENEVNGATTTTTTQQPQTSETKASSAAAVATTTKTATPPSKQLPQTKPTTNNNNNEEPKSTVYPDNKGIYEVKKVNQRPMKIKIQKGYGHGPNDKVVAIPGHHGFNGVQDDMEREMERRKHDWEKEVMKMQKEFFKLSPGVMSMGSGAVATPGTVPTTLGTEIIDVSNARNIYETKPDGSKVYKLRFNVKGFKPNELSVRIDGRTLRVTAKHEEEGDLGERASKNFDRKMDLPEGVDVDLLSSELSSNGILCIEAPANEVEEEENKVVYNVKEENDLPRLHHKGHWGQGHWGHQEEVEEYKNSSDTVDSGSFTIGEPFNATSLKGEDRIITPSHIRSTTTVEEPQYEWQRILQRQQQEQQELWEQQNQEPLDLHQHHRHRELFLDSPSNQRAKSQRFHRTPPTKSYTSTTQSYAPPESYAPTQSYAPASSYVQKREVFTPSAQEHHMPLPSGFKPGTEESETVYHSGGFITGPASAFSNALTQANNQAGGGADPFGANNPFNSLAASFAPMFQTSSKVSKRGSSHVEQVNQNASKLKLKVEVGEEYLPEDIQVMVDDRYIHVKASHEQVTPTGRTARREYNRTFDAPDDIDHETLRAVLGLDGRLIVGASLTTNRDKYAALDSVQDDMPPDGSHVQVLF